MDSTVLQKFGLNETQAKAYITLIQRGQIAPPALATLMQESRTNAYKVLDQLVELGLAKKLETNKKFVYRVENPTALEALALRKRNEALTYEKRIRDAMPTLLNYFYTFSEQPGVRFFHGEQGLQELLNDTLRVRKDIYVLRSPGDFRFLGSHFFDSYRAKRAKLGIKTHIVLQDNPHSRKASSVDSRLGIERTWLPGGTYSAPVEWDVYGDKVALISYGEEAMGVLIESPQIAESFRQIFHLLSAVKSYNLPKIRDNTPISSK